MAASEEPKIKDTTAAEAVVRKALEGRYPGRLRGVTFSKCSYVSARDLKQLGQEALLGTWFWDVEAVVSLKTGRLFGLSTEKRHVRHVVNAYSGEIVGYQETTPR